MATEPPIIRRQYDRSIPGVYGEFGAGAATQAFYIQSALTPAQLSWVSLISEIAGSETWPVRDLFQREVDSERVTSGLLPYLQDADKIKFFNPLTLTVLPMDASGQRVLKEMPEVEDGPVELDGRKWQSLERSDLYRLRWIHDHPEFAVLDWNDARSKLVAIDGQHRLSALKRLLRDADAAAHTDLMEWRIPIVIVSFRSRDGERVGPSSVLEVVRSIFVYINTEAKEINRAREILLSDESINAVCTQELLDRSHRNDVLPATDRAPGRLPLLFYDWRGEERGGKRYPSPAAVKSIEEVHDWLEYFILGEDFSDDQKGAFRATGPKHPLHGAFYEGKLSHADSDVIREHSKDILDSLSFLLEEFAPYHSYVTTLRELEAKYMDEEAATDLAHHAFYQLRFGTNHANDSERTEVARLVEHIREEVEDAKGKSLPELVVQDVGMRGIVSAFGSTRRSVSKMSWKEYAIWFTQGLNAVVAEGWLDLDTRSKKRHYKSRIDQVQHKFLQHVAEDHDGRVTNYRLADVDASLGTYVEILVDLYGTSVKGLSQEDRLERRNGLLDTLKHTVFRGYRKEVRPRLKEDYPDGGKPLTDAANKLATRLAEEHIRRFERELEKEETRLTTP